MDLHYFSVPITFFTFFVSQAGGEILFIQEMLHPLAWQIHDFN